jgi:cell wall-associated NlpC family hydrolase
MADIMSQMNKENMDCDATVVPVVTKKSSAALIISNESTGNAAAEGAPDLQAAFAKFRQQRIAMRRATKEAELAQAAVQRTPEAMNALRQKFINQAMSYLGIPYHPRYHGADSQYYNAPLYLDCCGLIRRVLFDLTDEFGFKPQRYNQAYQFDTLPVKFNSVSDMKPGDLIFYTGTYFNTKLKPQIHNVVHVEIFIGGETGEATIGARYQTGVVQVHNSYKFESKSYHSIEHHFRSLDPWLAGQCVSCCSQHAWDAPTYSTDKRSIFVEPDACEDAEPQEEEQS